MPGPEKWPVGLAQAPADRAVDPDRSKQMVACPADPTGQCRVGEMGSATGFVEAAGGSFDFSAHRMGIVCFWGLGARW